MAFVWVEGTAVGDIIHATDMTEIRTNIDSIKDNLANVADDTVEHTTHQATYLVNNYTSHFASHDTTAYASNCPGNYDGYQGAFCGTHLRADNDAQYTSNREDDHWADDVGYFSGRYDGRYDAINWGHDGAKDESVGAVTWECTNYHASHFGSELNDKGSCYAHVWDNTARVECPSHDLLANRGKQVGAEIDKVTTHTSYRETGWDWQT